MIIETADRIPHAGYDDSESEGTRPEAGLEIEL